MRRGTPLMWATLVLLGAAFPIHAQDEAKDLRKKQLIEELKKEQARVIRQWDKYETSVVERRGSSEGRCQWLREWAELEISPGAAQKDRVKVLESLVAKTAEYRQLARSIYNRGGLRLSTLAEAAAQDYEMQILWLQSQKEGKPDTEAIRVVKRNRVLALETLVEAKKAEFEIGADGVSPLLGAHRQLAQARLHAQWKSVDRETTAIRYRDTVEEARKSIKAHYDVGRATLLEVQMSKLGALDAEFVFLQVHKPAISLDDPRLTKLLRERLDGLAEAVKLAVGVIQTDKDEPTIGWIVRECMELHRILTSQKTKDSRERLTTLLQQLRAIETALMARCAARILRSSTTGPPLLETVWQILSEDWAGYLSQRSTFYFARSRRLALEIDLLTLDQ